MKFVTKIILVILIAFFSSINLYATVLIDEDFSSGTWPSGWAQNSAYVNTGNAHSETHKAGMNGTGDWIRTSLQTNPGTLTFWVRTSSDPDNWRVKIQTSPDGSTWTDQNTIIENGSGGTITNTYTQITTTLNLIGNYYIRFYMEYKGTGSCYIDDIYLDDYVISCTAPSTQASDISFSSVGHTSFTVSWTNGDGSNRVVKINTSNSFTDPVDGNEYTGNSTYSGSGEQIVYVGDQNSVTIDGLSPGTTYWIRVYEYNCTGSNTVYNTATATNNPNSQTTVACTTPSTAASDIQFSNVTSSAITVTWTNGDGENRIVVCREASAVTSTPSNGTTYNASSIFGNGDDIGSGEYVVYNGNGNSVTVTGLQDSTRYYFAVFEYNCDSGYENYLISAYPQEDTLTAVQPVPAVLERGDIVVVGVCSKIGDCGYGSSGDDEISFMCFKDITPGTEIDMTDNGWERCYPGKWGNAEGYLRIKRTGETILAGTVITIRFHQTLPQFEGVFPDNDWDLVINVGSLILNAYGDQLYFMQGGTWNNGTNWNNDATYTGGNIIFAFNTNDTWTSGICSANNNSAGTGRSQNSGLYDGMECFSMVPSAATDFLKYTGPTTPASQIEWIGRINDSDNWTGYADCSDYYAASPDYTNGDTLPITTTSIDEDFKWFGTRDSSWFNCANWSTLRVPQPNNSVEIPNSTHVERNIYLANGDVAECTDFTMNNPTYGLIAEGSNTKQLKINGDLTINAGFLDFDDDDPTTDDGLLYLKGNWNNHTTASAFVPGNSKVYFSGTGTQYINSDNKKENFYDLIISSGATVDANDDTLLIYGDWMNNGNFTENQSFVKFMGSNVQTINNASGSETFYKLEANNHSQLILNTNVAVSDTFYLNSGQLLLNGKTFSLYQLSRDSGWFYGDDNAIIEINAANDLYDSLFFVSGQESLNKLVLNNVGTTFMGTDLTVQNTLSLSSSSILGILNHTLTLNGIVSGIGVIRGSQVSSIHIGGSGNLGSLYFETNHDSLHDFYINRSSGQIYLGSNLFVVNNLTLNNGIVYTNSHWLTVTNPQETSVQNYSTSSYIDGNLRRYVNATGTYGLPVGDGNYEAATLKLNASSGITYVNAFFTHPSSLNTDISSLGLTLNGTPVTTLLDYGYWSIEPDNYIFVDYDITLTSRGHTNGGSDPAQHTIVKRHDSFSDWQVFPANHDNSTQSGTGTNPITAKLSALTGFSDFAIARSSEFPLPISLLSFTGSFSNNAVHLNWITESERNNAYFILQRADKSLIFNNIATIVGMGNSNIEQNYKWIDKDYKPGINYYKLLQVDLDGTTEDLKTIAVNVPWSSSIDYIIDGNYLYVKNFTEKPVNIKIYDLIGRTLIEKQNFNEPLTKINLSSLSKHSVYILKIFTEKEVILKTKFLY